MREGKENNLIENNNALEINTSLKHYFIRGVLRVEGLGITYLVDNTNLDKKR